MTATRASSSLHQASATRLGQLAALSDHETSAIREASLNVQRVLPFQDLAVEGRRAPGQLILLDGWLGRMRLFRDGRRQILGFYLPGDVIGTAGQPYPVATSTVTALTETLLCPAPAAPAGSGLAAAYATSAALDEFHLLRQIARLGRMSAYERMLDWLEEIHERLTLAGLAGPDSFAMPLTQELLSDALGLTSVHINRTLQAMRRDGVIELRNGVVRMKGSGPVENHHAGSLRALNVVRA